MGVAVKGARSLWTLDDSLEELAQLTESAGAEVVEVVSQQLPRPSHTYIGKGKIEEVKRLKGEAECQTVIVDDELSPSQQRALEEKLKCKVIDRTALILDVFASRARTREGRLQVELAQHEYLLPRLAGQWKHLERLGGGIGTRGPGESQLETDRRLVRSKIHRLKQEIEDVRTHRSLYREDRRRRGLPVVALVGYTNSGKSTLLNKLTGAGVLAADQLFATLDPVTRRWHVDPVGPTLLTDTVGFIQKLPAILVAAFRATLEELTDADLLLHVVDVAHPNAAEHVEEVQRILGELELAEKPTIVVLNKLDLLPTNGAAPGNGHPGPEWWDMPSDMVGVSAKRGDGMANLKTLIAEKLTTGPQTGVASSRVGSVR